MPGHYNKKKIKAEDRLRYANSGGGYLVYDNSVKVDNDYPRVAFMTNDGKKITYEKRATEEDKRWVEKRFKVVKAKIKKNQNALELNNKLYKNPHNLYTEDHEIWKRNVYTDFYYEDKLSSKEYNQLIKSSVERQTEMSEKEKTAVKIQKFKKEEPRAFQSAVDMQVEADIKNNPKWKSFTDKDKKELRARLVKRYNDNPRLIDERWYLATFRVYESKDFNKYMRRDAYTKGADKGNRGRAASFGNGKGKGWHGEQIRHRNAAMKGRGMRR